MNRAKIYFRGKLLDAAQASVVRCALENFVSSTHSVLNGALDSRVSKILCKAACAEAMALIQMLDGEL